MTALASHYLPRLAALGEIPPVDFAVHADTTWEASGTYEHAGTWLATHGVEVVTVQGKRTDVVREDWSGSVLIPAFTNAPNGHRGQVRRQCTYDWKIMPIREFIRSEMRSRGIKRRPGVVESLQGISLDEEMPPDGACSGWPHLPPRAVAQSTPPARLRAFQLGMLE